MRLSASAISRTVTGSSALLRPTSTMAPPRRVLSTAGRRLSGRPLTLECVVNAGTPRDLGDHAGKIAGPGRMRGTEFQRGLPPPRDGFGHAVLGGEADRGGGRGQHAQ